MMRLLLPLTLTLTLLACHFPSVKLSPVSPSAAHPQQGCESANGLELCLEFAHWNYSGLYFKVVATNTGTQSRLIDPEAFQVTARNSAGTPRGRYANDPRNPYLPGWERDYLEQKGLQKHTLEPGQRIEGLIRFGLNTYEDAAFREMQVLWKVEGQSYRFDFKELPPRSAYP